jgi:hypothetical protein
MKEPLDAAALEAFAVHARALIEFLWRDRQAKPKPRKSDALASDWFDGEIWRPESELPEELRDVARRTGWGVAHISYTRQRLHPTWDLEGIAHRIAQRFATFAAEVNPDLVLPGFCYEAEKAIIDWRASFPSSFVSPPPQSIATPADPSLWLAHSSPAKANTSGH